MRSGISDSDRAIAAMAEPFIDGSHSFRGLVVTWVGIWTTRTG